MSSSSEKASFADTYLRLLDHCKGQVRLLSAMVEQDYWKNHKEIYEEKEFWESCVKMLESELDFHMKALEKRS